MKKTTIALLIFTYIITFFAGVFLGKQYNQDFVEYEDPLSSAIFRCDQSKFIITDFFDSRVELRLSDGRFIIVPQTISGSGSRYAVANENFIFWNKGDNAFIEELGEITFENCIDARANH